MTVTLVAVVELVPGHAGTGRRYEDEVLALLPRHGGTLDWRRPAGDLVEVQVIRFASRAGYESFLADPQRLAARDRIGAAAPATTVHEV